MDLSVKTWAQQPTDEGLPPAPATVEDTGLSPGLLLDLLLKTIYRMGLETPGEVSNAMKLPVSVINALIEDAKRKQLVETLGQMGASLTAEMRYALTLKGREWALEALAQSEWVGPAPVTLEAFVSQIARQSIRSARLTRAVLEKTFSEMTLSEDLLVRLGPAVNCAASVLLYGPPGNGKSTIAEAVCRGFGGTALFPHAIVVDKQIISVFDPAVHSPALTGGERGSDTVLRRSAGMDVRYVVCRRPAVITGGELTLDRLDLALNTVSRVYEAPMQLKAAGGVLVIDDLGRQRQTPQQLMNRLIIPLESGEDYLSLETGRKFGVPFDALVIFSTNIPPKSLVDDAALRRLRFKVLVDRPDLQTFVQIFHNTAQRFGLTLTEDVLYFVLTELYEKTEGAEFAGFHPRYLIDQVRSISAFEGVDPELRQDFLVRAWENLFPAE